MEFRNERLDEKTGEYVYEVEMDDEEYAVLMELCRKNSITTDMFFNGILKYIVAHPEEIRNMVKEEMSQNMAETASDRKPLL